MPEEPDGMTIAEIFSALRGYAIDARNAKLLTELVALETRFREDYTDYE